MTHKFREAGRPYRWRNLAWTSICTAQKGKKVQNVNHTDCSSGVVSTRRRRLGIFALARLGKLAEKVAAVLDEQQRDLQEFRKGQACDP